MESSQSPPSSPSSSKKKRHHHSASTFYIYCKDFIEECQRNGRRFRTTKQGFEAAGLHWATLSNDERDCWKQKIRIERKNCAQDGSNRFKIRNGDRGDPNSDPMELGLIKDLSLKSAKDMKALLGRWTWLYSDQNGIGDEHFLIINASDSISGFTSLAVVEFSLKNGIIDQYHANVGHLSISNLASARYEAVRRVLDWPAKRGRRLGEYVPLFFVPPGQTLAVFNALCYVDRSTRDVPNWGNSEEDFSLTRNLADVGDLWTALCKWFEMDSTWDEISNGINGHLDTFDVARMWANRFMSEFSCI